MTDLRGRIEQVLREHTYWPVNHSSIGTMDHCGCGFRPRGWFDWSKHVAAVLRPDIDTVAQAIMDAIERQQLLDYHDVARAAVDSWIGQP